MARPSKTRVLEGQHLLLSPQDYQGPTGLVVLSRLNPKIRDCTQCPLHESRSKAVCGEGAWDSPKIAFVGEAPGSREDAEGRPFVGPSGALLNRLLEAMGLAREAVYITNTVKCRPEDNRTPTADEIQACGGFLDEELLGVKPAAIVALGATAAHRFMKEEESMRYARGRWHTWKGIRVRVTWHPSYVLRKDREDGGQARREMWDDMLAVMETLGIPVPERSK